MLIWTTVPSLGGGGGGALDLHEFKPLARRASEEKGYFYSLEERTWYWDYFVFIFGTSHSAVFCTGSVFMWNKLDVITTVVHLVFSVFTGKQLVTRRNSRVFYLALPLSTDAYQTSQWNSRCLERSDSLALFMISIQTSRIENVSFDLCFVLIGIYVCKRYRVRREGIWKRICVSDVMHFIYFYYSW